MWGLVGVARPQASPRESQRCPISSLAIVEPRSAFVFEERHAVLSGHRCRVTGKTKIRHWRGERIALLWQSCHIRESLTPDASRSRDTPARLCWQTASSRRLPAAVAARGVHQRERGRVRATVSSRPASWSCSRRARVPHCLWGWATMILATSLELWEN